MLESRESQTVLDDERSNEIGNEGGASVLVFFGMQVELALPLVPPQDDVLKNNKRCYDNILSECGISDPLQIYSGWLDEHEHEHGMQFWPPILLTHNTVLVSPW
jgi:hypothetical protein